MITIENHQKSSFIEQKITILQLVEGLYEEQNYQGNQRIISLIFSELNLTTEQNFNLLVELTMPIDRVIENQI